MPKTKTETIISDKDGYRKVSTDVPQPDGTTKAAVYTYFSQWSTLLGVFTAASADPKSAATLQASLLENTEYDGEESEQAFLMRLVNSSIGKLGYQGAYVAAQQASTYITDPVTKDRKNLLDLPVKSLVRGINGYIDQILTRMDMGIGREEAEDSVRFGPWRATKAKLIEMGKVKEVADGKVELVAA